MMFKVASDINIVQAVQKARKRCLKKFLYYFKEGYRDDKYINWERGYKFNAHAEFQELLNQKAYESALVKYQYEAIAQQVIKIESRTNLLFSFEKMALRDAVRSYNGAKDFAKGLYDYVYGKDDLKTRFEKFVEVIGSLPRKQTRVLTWPLVTVFGFIANPEEHIFLKPRVTQAAAEKYKFEFDYYSRPQWNTYKQLLNFAEQVRNDTKDYFPRDYIDLQSFIWVMGSEEYPD
jgi:hypothetical protein